MEKYAVDSAMIVASDDQLSTIKQLVNVVGSDEAGDITVKTASQAEKVIKDLESKVRRCQNGRNK